MSDIIEGRISRFLPGQPPRALIEVPLPDVDHVTRRGYERVLVEFVDNRRLSEDQRKKAWACIHEIAAWQGDIPQATHWLMKIDFKVKHLESLTKEIFSLRDCDMTTAREYISFLIDFMIRWGVPSKRPLYELCDDLRRYVYACAVYKRCAVCGKKAGLYSRDSRCIPLCRAHLREKDQAGDAAFYGRYHLETVPIDKKITKTYKLNVKEKTS